MLLPKYHPMVEDEIGELLVVLGWTGVWNEDPCGQDQWRQCGSHRLEASLSQTAPDKPWAGGWPIYIIYIDIYLKSLLYIFWECSQNIQYWIKLYYCAIYMCVVHGIPGLEKTNSIWSKLLWLGKFGSSNKSHPTSLVDVSFSGFGSCPSFLLLTF